jgi:hypothetical protein
MNYEKENLSKYDSVRLSLIELGFEEVKMHHADLTSVDCKCDVLTEMKLDDKYRIFISHEGDNLNRVYYFADTSGIPVSFHYVDDKHSDIWIGFGEYDNVTTHKVIDDISVSICKIMKDNEARCIGNFDFVKTYLEK